MRKHKLITIMGFGIFTCVFTLIMTQGGMVKLVKPEPKLKPFIQSNYNIKTDINIIKTLRKLYINKEEIKGSLKKSHPNKTDNLSTFKITAYDLSIQSCSKSRSDPDFGITKIGIDLRNKSWREARIVSVDPKVIPLGTKVRLMFLDQKYKKYNGIYLAGDSGNGVKGNKVDLFMGDFHSYKPSKEAKNFGVTKAIVTILKN